MFGTRVLSVRGRRTGQLRTTPVNPLTLNGQRYLVAPRPQTQWVRNLRVAGEAGLRVGSRLEHVRAVELADDEKPVVLREYLRRWKWEVGAFFAEVDASASQQRLRDVAANHPVFRVETLS